jgi:DNA-binding IclR family transcriptional regulator
MSHYLVRNKPFGGDLARRAEPLLEALSARLGEWVVLTAMAGTRRLVLLELNSSPQAVQLDRRALRLAEGAYDSASVWLFLAFGDTSLFERFQALNGLPADCPDPTARLAQVRQEGFCIYEDRMAGVAKVAFPIWQDHAVVAAAGVHLPAFRFVGDHRQAVMNRLADLAVQLGTGTSRSRA